MGSNYLNDQHMTKETLKKLSLLIFQSLNLQRNTHMMTYLLWEFSSNFNCCVLSNLELCQTMSPVGGTGLMQAMNYRSCSKCF